MCSLYLQLSDHPIQFIDLAVLLFENDIGGLYVTMLNQKFFDMISKRLCIRSLVMLTLKGTLHDARMIVNAIFRAAIQSTPTTISSVCAPAWRRSR